MGCSNGNFYDFLQKYDKRKTCDKKEAIKLMIQMVESCEHPLHYAAGYMAGDKPTTLAKVYVDENKQIEKFNKHIKDIVKQMRAAISLLPAVRGVR